jgi:acyl carrier protein
MNHEPDSLKLTSAEIESALLSIWSDALPDRGEALQTDAPFLALGGDSLSAMFCIARIRSEFSIEFNILDFFLDESTISDFARCIAAQQES